MSSTWEYAPILGSTLGNENTYGVVRRVPAGPFSFARVSGDDRHGRMQAYVGDGEFVDDLLDTIGSAWCMCHAGADAAHLQARLRASRRDEPLAHAAVLHEAFTTYFGWEVYYHGDRPDEPAKLLAPRAAISSLHRRGTTNVKAVLVDCDGRA